MKIFDYTIVKNKELEELKEKADKYEATLTPYEQEIRRQQKIEQDFNKLCNYNEMIAARGYQNE